MYARVPDSLDQFCLPVIKLLYVVFSGPTAELTSSYGEKISAANQVQVLPEFKKRRSF